MSGNQPKSNKRPWTTDEDVALLALVKEFGTSGSWPTIAQSMQFRTGKQCRERYLNQLDPLIKKSMWTEEEDTMILNLHEEHGKKWSRFMDHLPGRSDNAIKNRYHVISRDNFRDHQHKKRAHEDDGEVSDAQLSTPEEPDDAVLEQLWVKRQYLDQQIEDLLRNLKRPRSVSVDDGPQPLFGQPYTHNPSLPAQQRTVSDDDEEKASSRQLVHLQDSMDCRLNPSEALKPSEDEHAADFLLLLNAASLHHAVDPTSTMSSSVARLTHTNVEPIYSERNSTNLHTGYSTGLDQRHNTKFRSTPKYACL